MKSSFDFNLSPDKDFIAIKSFVMSKIIFLKNLERYKNHQVFLDMCVDRIASFGVSDYVSKYSKRHKNSVTNIRVKNSKIDINLGLNYLRIKTHVYIFEFIKFLKVYIQLLLALTQSNLLSKTKEYTLIYSLTPEQIYNELGEVSFTFIKSFFTKKNRQILIQAKNKDKNTLLTKSVVRYLIRSNKKKKTGFLMSKFTKDFFQILYLIILDKKLLIGSSSYLEGKCLQTLIDKFRLDLFLVCTQSQLVNQPSIFYFAKFHKFRTSMLWYSDNSLPLVSKSDYKIYRYDLSYLECRNIEMHYVMSKQFKKILSYYNQKKNIKVIQPFSFFYKYPLEISSSLVSNDKSFKIAYFPVTPMRNTPSDNFYSSTNLEKDLQRLIEVVDTFKGNKIEIELILKPKRQFTKTHSLKYAKLISEFQNMGLLTSISASSDPVRICKGMDLVICTPYTSVALLSKYLKVRSVYFIDRGSLTFFNPEPTIPLINGKIDLQRYINKCLKK